MLGFFNSPSRVHQKSVFKYECKFKREHASLTIKATDITTEMRLNLDGQIQYCPNEGIEPPTFWYYGSRLTIIIITTNRPKYPAEVRTSGAAGLSINQKTESNSKYSYWSNSN